MTKEQLYRATIIQGYIGTLSNELNRVEQAKENLLANKKKRAEVYPRFHFKEGRPSETMFWPSILKREVPNAAEKAESLEKVSAYQEVIYQSIFFQLVMLHEYLESEIDRLEKELASL